MRILFLLGYLLFSFISFADNSPIDSHKEDETGRPTLKCGWYLWDPYQYIEGGEGFKSLTGLDVQLVKAISRTAGYNVYYDEVSWRQHLEDLKTGERDIAAGATFTKERKQFYYYSEPYRREENALYVRKGELKRYNFGDVDQTLKEIQDKKLRVCVVDGFIYADKRINDFVTNPEHMHYLVKTQNDFQSLENLINGSVDCFFSDRLVASTIAWRKGKRDQIEEHYLGVGVDIHVIFSKKTIAPQQVEQFNKAIIEVKNSGEYGDIVKSYLLPVLLLQTTDRPWFLIIDIIGTIAFAISGLIVAFHDRTTLFGALIFASLPSVGGGIFRDIIVDRKPVGIMNTPLYAILILMIVMIGYLIVNVIYPKVAKYIKIDTKKWRKILSTDHLLFICDSLGQAAFTISGVVIAVATHSDPIWLWGPVLAAVTGIGGGLLRDMLREDRYIYALHGALYAEISLLWGFIVSVLLVWEQEKIDPDYIFTLVIVGMVGCFVTRMVTTYMGVQSVIFGEPIKRVVRMNKS